MRIKPLLLALALSATVSGCASLPRAQQYAERPNDLGGLIYTATERMIEAAPSMAQNKPTIVATTVNIDDLNSSSTFGRLASQLVSSRLSQMGYLVMDVTYTQALELAPGTGEMVLSREASRVAAERQAQAVVAGSYAVGGDQVYLNLRLLNAADGRLLSATDVVLTLDENTRRLVASGRNLPDRRAELGR